MNNFFKVIVAILGAISVVFDILIPIAIALLLVNVGGFREIWTPVLLVFGGLASFYKAIDIGFLR